MRESESHDVERSLVQVESSPLESLAEGHFACDL
jgi:hypothetical protein